MFGIQSRFEGKHFLLLSPLPQHLCFVLFCFVNSRRLICISIHVLFMAFWREISQDHLAVVCRHKNYSPCVHVLWVAISRLILQHHLTLRQPKEMNDLWDCHSEVAKQPELYILHCSFSFSAACRVCCKDTRHLCWWPGSKWALIWCSWQRQDREAELEGFTAHIPQDSYEVPATY